MEETTPAEGAVEAQKGITIGQSGQTPGNANVGARVAKSNLSANMLPWRLPAPLAVLPSCSPFRGIKDIVRRAASLREMIFSLRPLD